MSKGGRLGLIAVAIVVAVAAFLIVKPGDDDDDGGTPAAQTTEQPPTATAPSAPPPPPDAEKQPRVVIELRGHAVVGGEPVEIEAEKGDRVRFVVDSDEPDDIHVHGYDIEKSVAPGKPAKFSFTADIEGIFEIESHEAEHVGKDALIAKLVVTPS